MSVRSHLSEWNGQPKASEKQLRSVLYAERQIAHLRTLQEISRRLNSKLELEDILTSILDETIQTVGAERGCLFLVDAATGKLKVRLSRHLRPSDLTGKSFQPSQTVVERVWRDGKAVLASNAAEDAELSKANSVAHHALRSILCVPLHMQGQQIGVLYLDNRLKVGQFQEDSLALAVAIADQAAVALNNAQLYQAAQQELAERERAQAELRQRNRELALLNQAAQAFNSSLDLNQVLPTVLEGIRLLLEVTGAAIWLIDPETDELVCRQTAGPGGEILRGWRLALGQGLVGTAASSGESMIVPDAPSDERYFNAIAVETGLDLHSILCVPLRTKRGVIGVIQVVDTRSDRFSPADLNLVEALASTVAITSENAQLYARIRGLAVEEERHRLARELHDTVAQSLYSIGLAAQTSLEQLRQADGNSRTLNAVEHILTLSRTALTAIREQLYDLHPTTLSEKGLVEALAEYCHELRTRYLLSIALLADREPPLAMVQRENLYYIAREALSNVVKYAGATHVDVSLTTEKDRYILSVEDDGAGFDASFVSREETIGFRNIRERTVLMGGTFELQSGPGRGTRVTVLIPI